VATGRQAVRDNALKCTSILNNSGYNLPLRSDYLMHHTNSASLAEMQKAVDEFPSRQRQFSVLQLTSLGPGL
jgi:hypothetical protein